MKEDLKEDLKDEELKDGSSITLKKRI